MNILRSVKRYPVFFYVILTFAISWGGLLFIIGGPGQITVVASRFSDLLPMVILAILSGPSISGILLTFLVEGRTGFKDFKLSLTKKVNQRWYWLVLLGAPLAVSMVYFTLSLFSSKFVPGIITVDNKLSHAIAGL